jgi:hypothetical protein
VSHHLDSPASRRDPRLNVTDLYAFDGDDATGPDDDRQQLTRRPGARPAFIRKAVTSSRSTSTAGRPNSSPTASRSPRKTGRAPARAADRVRRVDTSAGGQQLHRLADLRHRPGDPAQRHRSAARPADDPANDTERIAAFVTAAVRRTAVSDPDGYGRAVGRARSSTSWRRPAGGTTTGVRSSRVCPFPRRS